MTTSAYKPANVRRLKVLGSLATLGLTFLLTNHIALAQDTSLDPNAIRIVLSPELETTLVSQMPGQLASVNTELGQTVKKGDRLISFNCAEPNARLHMAQAELAAAIEKLQTKERLHKLDAAGDSEVNVALAEKQRAEASVTLNRTQLTYCHINAPFDGYIVKNHVKPFQGVNAGDPLIELVSSGPLKIRLNVPSAMIKTLKIGSPFEVKIDETGGTYPAKVSAINARIDAVAQTIELEGKLDKARSELLPGMSGIAIFSP